MGELAREGFVHRVHDAVIGAAAAQIAAHALADFLAREFDVLGREIDRQRAGQAARANSDAIPMAEQICPGVQ